MLYIICVIPRRIARSANPWYDSEYTIRGEARPRPDGLLSAGGSLFVRAERNEQT